MERNYVIALVLMTVVMAVWILLIRPNSMQDYTEKKTDSAQKERKAKEEQSKSQASTKSTVKSEEDTDVDKSEKPETNEAISKRMVDLTQEAFVEVETDYYTAKLSKEKAIARSWSLKKYKRRDNKNKLINLIPAFALKSLDIKFINQPLQLKAMESSWQADKSKVILNERPESVTFRSQVGDNLEILKKFTFYNNSYIVDLDISFQNTSNKTITALSFKDESDENGYMLRWGPGMPADILAGGDTSGRRGSDNGARACTIEGDVEEELDEKKKRTPVKWVAFDNKYFMASMIPEPDLKAEYRVEENLKDVVDAGEKNVVAQKEAANLLISGSILKPGRTRTDHFRLYIGPKNNDRLEKVTVPVTEEPAQLNKVIDFGIFGFVAKIMLKLINIFHKITANYGVSIILLTVATKIVVYPLTRKSFKSMKEMQKLQPQMKELQEKYRDDPKKLNKAMMRLYKEHGVNPMSGCIPWLPQLPIFWALISTLRNSIELRGAMFIPYLASDLSAPADAVFSVLGLPIRILPIVNIGAMFLQQRITGAARAGAAAGGSQNKFMKYIPLVFVLIFYNWASGFVLYFLCNNILMGLQQYIINKVGDDNEDEKTESK